MSAAAEEEADMMAEIRLYDSTICRLCAESSENGEMLFTGDEEDTELSAMVNRYLPLKIHDDGKLPRTICPGCNIQLEATAQFFELLINGQQKIREMWKQQVDFERKIERERLKQKNINLTLENSEFIIPDDENPPTETSDKQIIINVMPDGSVYAAEHDLSLQMEGLDRPRRKRGRPPKGSIEEEFKVNDVVEKGEAMSQEEEDKQNQEEFDGDGRSRRKRKVPKRYMETVQGKELEKMFKEEGVFDEDEIKLKYEPIEVPDTLSVDSSNSDSEIIGHLETVEGKNLGELVVVNRNKVRVKSKVQKSKVKKKHKFECNHCGKGFVQRSKYIVHQSLHKTIRYECTECQDQYLSKEDLLLHQNDSGHSGDQEIEANDMEDINVDPDESVNIELLNTVEPNQTMTSSLIANDENCSSTTMENNQPDAAQGDAVMEEELYQEFEAKDEEEGTYRCEKCSKHFQSKDNLETHIKVVHQGEKPFVCDVCSKAFAYESSLKGHMEIVHQCSEGEKGFPCDICGKVLSHSASVMYHKLTEHNNGRRFVCNKCGKSFKHKQLLHRHQLVHSEDRPYPCTSCDAAFKTKANLLNHQSTHTGEKKHFCELCDHKFAHKTSLTLHYRTHTGQRPYKCEVCSKGFSQNGNLQEHMRIHTGEKPYCCDHCGRKFTTSSQFKLHVKRHTGERPWKCEFCSKSFLHKDTWKCHVRRHTGERPFQCAYCNRGFTEQWALKKHLRLHTGEKPYTCEVCGKAFADCSNLTKHKKVHKTEKVADSVETQEGNPVGQVWQILPNPQEDNTDSALDNMPQVVATNGVSAETIPRIIYVTYQNPDEAYGSEDIYNKESILPDHDSNSSAAENNDPINMELAAESDLQLEITDEDGNAIPLSMQQARQFLSQFNGDQAITLKPTSLETNANIQTSLVPTKENITPKTSAVSTFQSDAEDIVRVLEDESTDATAVAAINQMNAENRLELAEGQQTIEFITQDGQKVRLVTSLNIDPLQLPSEYLNIV